jgi:hypothetical protein
VVLDFEAMIAFAAAMAAGIRHHQGGLGGGFPTQRHRRRPLRSKATGVDRRLQMRVVVRLMGEGRLSAYHAATLVRWRTSLLFSKVRINRKIQSAYL